MMLLLCIPFVWSTIFPVIEKDNITMYKKILKNTVVMFKTTVMYRQSKRSDWIESVEVPSVTSLNIYKPHDKYSTKLDDDSLIVFKDNKYESNNTFFFTSSHGSGNYIMEFSLDSKVHGDFALRIDVFEGKAYNPEIMSGLDYQMVWLTQKITDLLSFAKNNFEIQTMDETDEVEYVKLYNYIFSLLFRVSIVKIVVLLISIFYVNKTVKTFFRSQRIGK